MNSFVSIGIGWFLGFVFGVGCSLVVLYAIYLGGYKKAIEDSMLTPPPENYIRLHLKAERALIPSAVH